MFCVLLHLFVHLDFISLKCSFLNSLSSAVELNEIIALSVFCYNNWYLLAMITIFIK